MKKKLLALLVACFIVLPASAQVYWGIKGGLGTSWLAFPKVYLQDPVIPENTWEIAPATNNATYYVEGEMYYELSDHMGFRAALGYSFFSGEVSVTSLLAQTQERRLQMYHRLQVPVLFSIRSDDSFWFSLGPTVFVNLADNNALEEAVTAITQNDVPLDVEVPIGVAWRLVANIRLKERLFLEVKFDYDLGKHFNFNETSQRYDVKMAMQGISSGINYVF